ncbi:MAG TPA: glycoside hydrolase domain-containing protein, partial [Acidobacteriota bacterium]|nr:glycoside hydrolase domain-containing protein [Acidobacteriota bacterium]
YVRRGQGATAGGKTEAGGKATLVALASWAKEPVDARLTIDWKALGLDPKTVKIVAPVIDKFQEAAELKPGGPVRVDPGKGLLLILH